MRSLSGFSTLDDLLDAVVERRFCASVSGTTCGAVPLRHSVANVLAERVGRRPREVWTGGDGLKPLTTEEAVELVPHLRGLARPVQDRPSSRQTVEDREAALRLMIHDAYSALRGKGRGNLGDALGVSWASEVSDRMVAHAASRAHAQLAHYMANSPEARQHRREEKARAREQRLRERAILKAEIDRLWRLRQMGTAADRAEEDADDR